MVVGVEVFLDTRNVDDLIRRVSKDLPIIISDATLETAKISAKAMERQLLLQTKKAPRHALANQIRARKIRKDVAVVTVPIKAHWLDTMRPHFVSLKPGRLIRDKWARRYYERGGGTFRKAGKSRVFMDKAGRIKGGVLWVTKDPFISKSLNKIRGRYKGLLVGAVRRVL